MQFGRSYEEFEVGATYKHWPGKTVTEYDDHLFCLLTMNHHPLHLDSNYAQETTQFGQNVVVGNYVYSILLGMSVPDISGKAIANLEIESLRHVAPTFHGDTLYGETTVLDKWESTSKDDRGVVHVETIGYKQDGTIVCIFRRKVMVPKDSYLEARGGEQPGPPDPGARPELARAGGAYRLIEARPAVRSGFCQVTGRPVGGGPGHATVTTGVRSSRCPDHGGDDGDPRPVGRRGGRPPTRGWHPVRPGTAMSPASRSAGRWRTVVVHQGRLPRPRFTAGHQVAGRFAGRRGAEGHLRAAVPSRDDADLPARAVDEDHRPSPLVALGSGSPSSAVDALAVGPDQAGEVRLGGDFPSCQRRTPGSGCARGSRVRAVAGASPHPAPANRVISWSATGTTPTTTTGVAGEGLPDRGLSARPQVIGARSGPRSPVCAGRRGVDSP